MNDAIVLFVTKSKAPPPVTNTVHPVKAMEMGELTSAISSLFMVVAGLMTVVLAPLMAHLM